MVANNNELSSNNSSQQGRNSHANINEDHSNRHIHHQQHHLHQSTCERKDEGLLSPSPERNTVGSHQRKIGGSLQMSG